VNFADAAHQILTEKGGPLSSQVIAQLARDKGLISPKSDSPGTFVAAAMRKENRRRKQAGQPPRFVVKGQGMFDLV
jgi:hypothetical protein